MTELQNSILDVFMEFKRVCDENNLRYYAIGGTCLGAIRHKGFIPWDDDIDVAMPWEDYQRLRREWKHYVRAPYQLLDFEQCQHSDMLFLKLFNGSTTYIEEHVVGMPDRYTGIFMDIMPIVGVPDAEEEKERLLKTCIRYLRLNRSRRFEFQFRPTLKAKLFSIVTKPLMLGKPFHYYSQKYEEMISQYPFGATKRVLFPWRIPVRPPYKNVFPYAIFEECATVPFEDTEICVPKDYEQYLTMDFGDYRKLPPEDKRHGGHNAAVIDFHKSYKEYQEAGK